MSEEKQRMADTFIERLQPYDSLTPLQLDLCGGLTESAEKYFLNPLDN